MDYLTAFCDVIMAKIGRLDVELANKAKSDFISSISHELRSPLHGILGTTDILQEQAVDTATAQMISQIESCGRTLLDIVDHLLDFSKINSFVGKTRTRNGTGQKGRKSLIPRHQKARSLGEITSADNKVALDKITEEVIETTVYSYSCSKDPAFLSARNVVVAMEVDRSLDRYSIAVGAWKRVCMNLVNNALKYTHEGYILVSLKTAPRANRQRRPSAQFIVMDSGRGMSKQYLDNQLFRAFTQEDDLAEGTGLGMSMVAKIVKALGGKVDVQSEKNVGTTVTVTIPLEMCNRLQTDEKAHSSLPAMGLSFDFLGSPLLESNKANVRETARSIQSITLRKALSELKISVPTPTWTTTSTSKLVMISEADVPHLVELLGEDKDMSILENIRSKPLLVICNDYMSLRRMKESALSQLKHGHIQYVSQPCGLERLNQAIQACLGGVTDNIVDKQVIKSSTELDRLTIVSDLQNAGPDLPVSTPPTAFLCPQSSAAFLPLSNDSRERTSTSLALPPLRQIKSPSVSTEQIAKTLGEYPFPKASASEKTIPRVTSSIDAKLKNTEIGHPTPMLTLLLVDDNVCFVLVSIHLMPILTADTRLSISNY